MIPIRLCFITKVDTIESMGVTSYHFFAKNALSLKYISLKDFNLPFYHDIMFIIV